MQGHKDSPLTEKGQKNAQEKGKKLRSKNIEIIYSSDLGRCVEAAEIINYWLKVRVVKTPKLRERNFGIFNGWHYKKIKEELNLDDPDEKAPKGESFNQQKKRVISFVKSLAKKKFKKVLLITHDGSVKAILSEYCKKCSTPSDAVYKLEIGNKGKGVISEIS